MIQHPPPHQHNGHSATSISPITSVQSRNISSSNIFDLTSDRASRSQISQTHQKQPTNSSSQAKRRQASQSDSLAKSEEKHEMRSPSFHLNSSQNSQYSSVLYNQRSRFGGANNSTFDIVSSNTRNNLNLTKSSLEDYGELNFSIASLEAEGLKSQNLSAEQKLPRGYRNSRTHSKNDRRSQQDSSE